MSLILEALKKSEQKRRLGHAPNLGTPFASAPPRRNLLPYILAAIVVAGGVGWWFSRESIPLPAPTGAHAPNKVKQTLAATPARDGQAANSLAADPAAGRAAPARDNVAEHPPVAAANPKRATGGVAADRASRMKSGAPVGPNPRASMPPPTHPPLRDSLSAPAQASNAKAGSKVEFGPSPATGSAASAETGVAVKPASDAAAKPAVAAVKAPIPAPTTVPAPPTAAATAVPAPSTAAPTAVPAPSSAATTIASTPTATAQSPSASTPPNNATTPAHTVAATAPPSAATERAPAIAGAQPSAAPPPSPATAAKPSNPSASAAAAAPSAAANAPAAAPGPEVANNAAKEKPGQVTIATKGGGAIPLYYELPYGLRKDLPPLTLSMHVFASDPAQRFIILNDARQTEGDTLTGGELKVHEIRPDGVVLELRGQQFLLPRSGN